MTISTKIKYFRQLVFSRSWKELLNRSIELTFGYILYGISFLCIRKKNRWVFGTNVGFADNAKYLFLYVKENHPEIDACWIASSRQAAKELIGKNINAAYKYSWRGLRYCLTARYYIFTYHSKDINFFTSGGSKKINLWHGVGIKKGSKIVSRSMPEWVARIALPHLYEHFDLFLSTSDVMSKHFKNMFGLEDKTIYEGLYPRCSYMLSTSKELIKMQCERYKEAKLREEIERTEQYEKVYIYMPTWRANLKDSFLDTAGIDFERLDEQMRSQNSLFIMKLHPAVKLESKHYGQYKNILILDKGIDIYPLLPFTTHLITDYSSIYYDYLLLQGKKIILYPFDIEDYQKSSDELAFSYEEYTPGKRVYNFEELLEALSADKDLDIAERDWVLQTFWGEYADKPAKQLFEKILTL